MNTDDLVTMLARGPGAESTNNPEYRFFAAIGWGALGATLLMAMLLGVRHDLADAVSRTMFWVKLGYVVSLAAAVLFALSRLSRPGARVAGAALGVAAPILLIWSIAAIELAAAEPAQVSTLVFGKTWASCPVLIATLAVPSFVAMTWATKGFAPTRLRLAGGAVGLAAGAIAAAVYSLHCAEMSAPFLGLWYLAGLLIPGALGVLAGPLLLRW